MRGLRFKDAGSNKNQGVLKIHRKLTGSGF